jgi:hypothetical protein
MAGGGLQFPKNSKLPTHGLVGAEPTPENSSYSP